MYTLVNGQKVKELIFKPSGIGPWEISQNYWLNGKLVHQAYNTETGEIILFDGLGRMLESNEYYSLKDENENT